MQEHHELSMTTKRELFKSMSLNMCVNNKKIAVEEMEVGGATQSSLILIGDADVITCSSVFDTPADSLLMNKEVPIRPLARRPILTEPQD